MNGCPEDSGGHASTTAASAADTAAAAQPLAPLDLFNKVYAGLYEAWGGLLQPTPVPPSSEPAPTPLEIIVREIDDTSSSTHNSSFAHVEDFDGLLLPPAPLAARGAAPAAELMLDDDVRGDDLVSQWGDSVAEDDREKWLRTEYEQLGAHLYELRDEALSNMAYFSGIGSVDITAVLTLIATEWGLVEEAALRVAHAAARNDCDPFSVGNGHRSVLKVLDVCAQKLLLRLRHCSKYREKLLFNAAGCLSYFSDYATIFSLMRKVLQHAVLTDSVAQRSHLFLPASEAEVESQAITSISSLDCSAFYGQRVAFFHAPRFRNMFRIITSAMAAYGEGFHTQQTSDPDTPEAPPAPPAPPAPAPAPAPAAPASADGGGDEDASYLGGAVKVHTDALAWHAGMVNATAAAMVHGVGFLLAPRHRAQNVVKRFRNCDIAFAKGFWDLTDTAPLSAHAGSLVAPWMSVNRVVSIPITEESLLAYYTDGPLGPVLTRAVSAEDASALASAEAELEVEATAGNVSAVEALQFGRVFRHKTALLAAAEAASAETAPSGAVAEKGGGGGDGACEDGGSGGGGALEGLSRLLTNLGEGLGVAPCAAGTGPLGSVPAQLLSHVPAGQVPSSSTPLLIHVHGGGFVAQSPKSHESYLRHWARDLQVPVLSIDYSLAPEAWFPRAVDECFHAFMWAMEHREDLGAGRDGRIVIAGDSAGGNLAVAVCLKAVLQGVRPPAGVVCAYPVLNVKLAASPSRLLALMDSLLPLGLMECCLEAYRGPRLQSVDNPLMSPLNASDEMLRLMPPVRVVACELDPLLDDSVMFVKRLRTMGHDATLQVIPDMPHGFLSLAYVGGGEGAMRASALVVGCIRELLLQSSEGEASAEQGSSSVFTDTGCLEQTNVDHFARGGAGVCVNLPSSN